MAARHDFVQALVHAVRDLQPLYERHMIDNFGELLPHVFLGDLTRFVITEHREALRTRVDRPVLVAVLGALEKGLVEGDADVAEVIVVSFLENLWQAGDEYQSLRGRLGPELRRQLEVIEMAP
jgi:hypothetical protein